MNQHIKKSSREMTLTNTNTKPAIIHTTSPDIRQSPDTHTEHTIRPSIMDIRSINTASNNYSSAKRGYSSFPARSPEYRQQRTLNILTLRRKRILTRMLTILIIIAVTLLIYFYRLNMHDKSTNSQNSIPQNGQN